jgi:hypothetical protein
VPSLASNPRAQYHRQSVYVFHWFSIPYLFENTSGPQVMSPQNIGFATSDPPICRSHHPVADVESTPCLLRISPGKRSWTLPSLQHCGARGVGVHAVVPQPPPVGGKSLRVALVRCANGQQPVQNHGVGGVGAAQVRPPTYDGISLGATIWSRGYRHTPRQRYRLTSPSRSAPRTCPA